MKTSARDLWEESRPSPAPPFSTACVAPWVSLEFDPSGWVYACCASALYPIGRIGDLRLHELWDGSRMRVLRRALKSWDLTVACGPCKWHLEHGRSDPVAAVYDRYPVSGEEPDAPYMMSFALSNRCNLACVMCSAELSSTIRAEAGMTPLKSPYDDQFFEDLAEFLPKLKLAKFLGGEPFLSREHQRVWDLMEQLSVSPRLQITTNGTIWTERVQHLLETFEVDISVSVDAVTSDTYSQLRRHGNLETVMENLDRFSEVCGRRSTDLHVSYCLMEGNWFELADFLSWADRFEVPASINLVTDPGLAVHDLPLNQLRAIRKQWERDEERIGDGFGKNASVWATQIQQLESVISERSTGQPPPPRQAQPAPPTLFAGATDSDAVRGRIGRRRHARRAVARERDELAAWSSDGTVAVLNVDRAGVITRVTSELPVLRIDADLIGTQTAQLIAHIEDVMARPTWVIELDEQSGRVVRTVVSSLQRPARGVSGAVLRTIQVPDPRRGNTVLLMAIDWTYELPEGGSTPVRLNGRVSAPSARAEG